MNEPSAASITVPGRIESVRPAAAFLVQNAQRLSVPMAASGLFEVAIVEALTNALKHNKREGEAPIHCEIELVARRLVIRVIDEAAPAPPVLPIPVGAVPWPDVTPASIQHLAESGYGLYLIRAVFPEIHPVTRNGLHGVELVVSLDSPATEL